MLARIQARSNPDDPPAMVTDGKGCYREALLETWGKVPPYRGQGRPPVRKQPEPSWHYLRVVKEREGGRVVGVRAEVVYGDEATTRALLGEHTAYVERTNLTSRQMNPRLVRKTLSYSKKCRMLEAACAWEDGVYNLIRPVKTLRVEIDPAAKPGQRRWQARTPAMAAGLVDHVWTVKELLTTLVLPEKINTL